MHGLHLKLHVTLFRTITPKIVLASVHLTKVLFGEVRCVHLVCVDAISIQGDMSYSIGSGGVIMIRGILYVFSCLYLYIVFIRHLFQHDSEYSTMRYTMVQ